jgi:hypothetical protein
MALTTIAIQTLTRGVQTTFYRDADGDGYGDSSDSQDACSAPSGYVTNSTDCDDSDSAVNPGATEACDGIDNDCDSDVDEGVQTTFYRDADGDGYGDSSDSQDACSAPSGYVTNSTDCDDSDSAVNPGATEACDGIDNDCDSDVDEGVQTTFYRDADGDGYGDSSDSQDACSAPSGYVTDNTDCDDSDNAANPGASGSCGDNTPPNITSGTTGNNLAENTGTGQTVYTITATDDVAVTSYAIAGADVALLNVNSSTGVVTLTSDPDYEAKSSYSFTVTASDAASNTSTATTVTFSITNVDDTVPTITSGTTGTDLAENSGSGQTVYTITADANDGGTIQSYAIAGCGLRAAKCQFVDRRCDVDCRPGLRDKEFVQFHGYSDGRIGHEHGYDCDVLDYECG